MQERCNVLIARVTIDKFGSDGDCFLILASIAQDSRKRPGYVEVRVESLSRIPENLYRLV